MGLNNKYVCSFATTLCSLVQLYRRIIRSLRLHLEGSSLMVEESVSPDTFVKFYQDTRRLLQENTNILKGLITKDMEGSGVGLTERAASVFACRVPRKP